MLPEHDEREVFAATGQRALASSATICWFESGKGCAWRSAPQKCGAQRWSVPNEEPLGSFLGTLGTLGTILLQNKRSWNFKSFIIAVASQVVAFLDRADFLPQTQRRQVKLLSFRLCEAFVFSIVPTVLQVCRPHMSECVFEETDD
eukprot:2486241-Prymnesium_polylepis.1